jgi:preprotein translocase subunit SecD
MPAKKKVSNAKNKKVKSSGKIKKVKKVSEEIEEENEGGMDLDDAFGDDENVEYGKPKEKKVKKGMSEDEIEEDLEEAEEEISSINNVEPGEYILSNSKPISKVKKGDKIRIDGKEYEVDSHYVLIDHGTTKEMAIELFDSKSDKDYQLRYFDDQIETTMEFYELQEIMYIKKPFSKIDF